MAEESKKISVTDGTYVLSESEEKNVMYFYRKDGKSLTDKDMDPMDFYHFYIMQKMINGDISGAFVANNICCVKSDDGTVVKMTIGNTETIPLDDIDKTTENSNKNRTKTKKRSIFSRIFGK